MNSGPTNIKQNHVLWNAFLEVTDIYSDSGGENPGPLHFSGVEGGCRKGAHLWQLCQATSSHERGCVCGLPNTHYGNRPILQSGKGKSHLLGALSVPGAGLDSFYAQ